MKKFYVLLFSAVFAITLNAQVEVTFAVDMNVEAASTDGVFVTGNWMDDAGLGGEWQEPGTNMDAQLTDSDGDKVYTLTVMLPDGDYQFKYANGNGWANAEAGGDSDNYQADLSSCGGVDNGFGGYNRTFTIAGSALAITPYEFNSCNVSTVDVTEISTLSDVTIAPNPAADFTIVTYANPNNANHDIIVTSLTGQVVKQFYNIVDNTVRIETQDLTAGMYFITFRNELGEQGTEKFIVK